MKKKDGKITIKCGYEISKSERHGFEHALKHQMEEKDGSFTLEDGSTVLFGSPLFWIFDLYLTGMKDVDRACLDAISKIEDKSKLQMSYDLQPNSITITFYTTNLTNEDIDMTMFDKFSLTDIDPKTIVGLFTDNRFHG